MSIVNFNGELIDSALIADYLPKFKLNEYPLLEGILIENNHIPLWNLHWERVLKSMNILAYPIYNKFTAAFLYSEIIKTVAQNHPTCYQKARIRIFKNTKIEQELTIYIIEIFALENEVLQLNEKGLTVGVSKHITKPINSASNLKIDNIALYTQAKEEILTNHWDEVLICNEMGRIIESSIAAIFWIKDEKIYTPPLSEGCIDSVKRRQLLTKYPAIIEMPLTREMLFEADEVFTASAIRNLRWIRKIDDRIYRKNVIEKYFQL